MINRLKFAQDFAGRIESLAYGIKSPLFGGLYQGGATVRNDGALSKVELSAALASGKLSAKDKRIAKDLLNNFGIYNLFKVTGPQGLSTLDHSEIAYVMEDRLDKRG